MEEDLSITIARLAKERADRERSNFIKQFGDSGIAAAMLEQKGLLDD